MTEVRQSQLCSYTLCGGVSRHNPQLGGIPVRGTPFQGTEGEIPSVIEKPSAEAAGSQLGLNPVGGEFTMVNIPLTTHVYVCVPKRAL
jgi:hypothetical protein